jgi:Zn-dependent protease with chaperone function
MDRLISARPRIRKMFEGLERSAEEEFYLINLADNTRLSANQAPTLYRMVEEVAALAQMDTPTVFLDTQPEANAYVLGGQNASMVLTSALVDEFNEAQIRAVIAHELGHIRCQHTFYRMVSEGFDPVAAMAGSLPGGAVVALALRWHLMDWFRKSELSADRFSLLVTGDLDVVQSVILRLAGGASSLRDELSNDAFRLQAKEFRKVIESRKRGSLRDRIEYYTSSVMLQQVMSTHPWPAVRFVEIEDWAKSSQYELILKGELERAALRPSQYIPETEPDEDVTDAELMEGADDSLLRQATSDLAGKWKKRRGRDSATGTPSDE